MRVCLAMGPGSTVAGRYLVESLAGEGGMGRVFRAEDKLTGATVALKVLGQHGRADRIAAESDALALLDHPAVVRYVGHGVTDEGEPFLVMEWLAGEPLDQRLQRTGFTLKETLTLAATVAEALEYIHAQGVVHRDLKPANLVLATKDVRSVKIVDFGIARLTFSRPLTATGLRVGTLYYMAPEQYSHPRLVDGRADVFAFGCILFECLTGRRAFEAGDDIVAFARVVLEQAPALRAVRPEIPAAIDELVGRLLARDRTKRPPANAALRASIAKVAGELAGSDLGRPRLTKVELTPAGAGITFAASDAFSVTEPRPSPNPALRAASLPQAQHPIIGREDELLHLDGALEAAGGVITLWGPAGIGKTRLALEAAHRWIRKDGTRGAALASLRQAADVDGALRAIATALSPASPPGGTADEIEQAIVRILRARELFALVLDGAERVAAALEPVLSRWTGAAKHARLLVTSRQRGGTGVLFELGSLPADSASSPAVRLFLERAGPAAKDLQADPDSMPTILRIVRALDNNPLAIELAAARLEVLGLGALLERLSRPLEVLGRSGSLAPAAANAGPITISQPLTMAEAIAWSWELLEPDEKIALSGISVFRGSFTAEAAEAILGTRTTTRVIDVLQSLRDRSLLASTLGRTSVQARLSMSSSVRDFARTKLTEVGLSDEMYDRHASYFAGAGEPLAERVAASGDVAALRALAAQTDELLGAFEHAIARSRSDVRQLPIALAALLAVDPVLTTRGPFGKHKEMLDLALARADEEGVSGAIIARLRQARGRVALRLGQNNGARADLERAVEEARRAGQPDAEASALLDLGVLHHAMRDLDLARRLYESVALLDTDNPVVLARALGNLGAMHHDALRFDDAYACYVEAIALFESLGDPRPVGLFLANLAMLDFDRGRIADAARRFGRALRHLEEAEDPRLLAIALGSLGMLELGEGHVDIAIGRFERAHALLQEASDPRSEALGLGRLSAALACKGQVEPATAAIVKGERIARRDPIAKDTLRLFRGFIDAAYAKAALAEGRAAEARASLDALRERIRVAGEPRSGERPLLDHSDDARAALRLLRPMLEKLVAAPLLASPRDRGEGNAKVPRQR
jgi:serine/threonine protein kinase/predicted ATPase